MDSLTVAEKTLLWVKNSVLLKLVGIGGLILVLLVPMSMLKSLIAERSALQDSAIAEISAKWGSEQCVAGPILTIPYTVNVRTASGSVVRELRYAHFLPEELNINGELTPRNRYRGIYKAVLYESTLEFSGKYAFPQIDAAQTGAEEVQYDKAFLQIGVPDMRGIGRSVSVDWNGTQCTALPGIPTDDIANSGIHVPVALPAKMNNTTLSFAFNLAINGSERLSFVPVGKETSVTLRSTWSSPSFDGTFLPQQHEITDDGFSAQWKVLYFNRNFPQSWRGSGYKLHGSSCGVSMVTPVAHYHMVTRSVKYAVLIIFLTFLLFFMIELMKRFRVHPFQYLLIGTGLVLFYALLLSISEHIVFPAAYAIAAGATTLLLSLYTLTIVRSVFKALLVGVLFSILYGFLYIILRSEDYALLIGSTALFLLLGTLMFLTRNVNWYQLRCSDNRPDVRDA